MRKLSVCFLLIISIPGGCSRTVDVNPPANVDQSPAATPESTSAEAETASPFGSQPAGEPAAE